MAAIVIKGMGGMRPILDPKLLRPNEAQVAENVRLSSGNIEPIRENEVVIALKSAGTVQTIYRAQSNSNEETNWLEFADDADVVRSPITADEYDRIYWTSSNGPRYAPTSVAFAAGSGPYPRASYRLGVPKPAQAPIVAGTPVVEPELVDRWYLVTFTNDDGTKESGPSAKFRIKCLTDHYDTGTRIVAKDEDGDPQITKPDSMTAQVVFESEHDLTVDSYIVMSGSDDSDWNAEFQVTDIPNVKTIQFTVPSGFDVPTGDIIAKRRYKAEVKLFNLPTDNGENGEITKKNVYRKLDDDYYLIATLDLDVVDYTDDKLDSEISGFSTLDSALMGRPPRPEIPPSAFISVDDEVSANTGRKTGSFSAVGTVCTITLTDHKYVVGQQLTLDFNKTGGSGSATVDDGTYTVVSVLASNKFTVTVADLGTTTTTGPFGQTTTTNNTATGNVTAQSITVTRVYALSFVSGDDVEGPLSKSTGFINAIESDGIQSSIKIIHGETIPDGSTKKRIYRQVVTPVDGTFEAPESAYQLVSEVPVTQDTYIDTVPQAVVDSLATAPTLLDALDPPEVFLGGAAKRPPQINPETRVYVYTYVSAYGEEGPPSEPSTAVSIDPYEPVLLSAMSGAPTGDYNITKKYIYRTNTGTQATDYQFVAEVPVATTTYSDVKKNAELGEVIPSASWNPPPTSMRGLRMMANGVAVGFDGSDVYFSEPFLPHAFPEKYRVTLEGSVVGVGTYAQNVVVLTDSYPVLITGVDPSAMVVTKIGVSQACVSKRSIVETDEGVLYASPDGLMLISGGGIRNITQGVLSQEQWQAYNPSSFHAYLHEGRYHAFYSNGNESALLVIDFQNPNAFMTEGAQSTTAAHVVATADSLYLVEDGYIAKYDKSATALSYLWRSKVQELPSPTSMVWCQVIAKSYDPAPVVRVYGDGSEIIEKSVSSVEPFKLPSGKRYRDWEIEVEGEVVVEMLGVAHTTDELKAS